LAKDIHYTFGERYTLYVWRKIYIIRLAKDIHYTFGERYTLYVWRETIVVALYSLLPA